MTKRVNPLDRYAADIAPGELTWIGVRPRRREPLQSITSTKAVATLGLEGDHRMGKTPGFGATGHDHFRRVHRANRASFEFERYRSGYVAAQSCCKGLNLNALRRQRFRIGGALFEATQLCHPGAHGRKPW